ncbi:ABC transporter substrate-binding protein [Ensifer adhaerens]|uniref:ABC transporter substrate-binding protein n=1 Tax=Ensifer adhaerens TaxID=106592 RepID=UPI0007C7DB4F|nr:ABC transporter substrate-binding protein [Ensifer adhaerens]
MTKLIDATCSRRTALKLALGGGVAFLVPWGLTSSALAADSPQSGGTMIFLVQPEPPSLALYASSSGPIEQIGTKIYEGLLEVDAKLQPAPGLASEYSIADDGLSATFKLRKGVKWHDGEPLTSADVQFSFMEVLKKLHPRASISLKNLVSVDTPDDATVVMKFSAATPYLARVLSGKDTPIVPKHLMAGKDLKNLDLANRPVGTGPYKFVEWRRGQFVLLEKNQDYWREGLPRPDRLVGRFIADAATRVAALENSEVHLAALGAIPAIEAKRLDALPYLNMSTEGYGSLSSISLLEFNTKVHPFDKKEVRQAVSHVIDREYIVQNIFQGFGTPAKSCLSSQFSAIGINPGDLPNYPRKQDLARAAELLDAAGLKPDASGIRAEVVHDIIPYGEEWRRLGEYIKQALEQVGIRVTLRYEDAATWTRRLYTEYDFQFSSTYHYHLIDPVLGAHRFFLSSSIKPGVPYVNVTRFSNEKVDKLLEQAMVELDREKRAGLYHEFQAIIADEMPSLHIHDMQFATVSNTVVMEHSTSGLGPYGPWYDLWIKAA